MYTKHGKRRDWSNIERFLALMRHRNSLYSSVGRARDCSGYQTCAVLSILAVAGSNPAGEILFLHVVVVLLVRSPLTHVYTPYAPHTCPPMHAMRTYSTPCARTMPTNGLTWVVHTKWPNPQRDKTLHQFAVARRVQEPKLLVERTWSRWCSWLSRLLHTQ